MANNRPRCQARRFPGTSASSRRVRCGFDGATTIDWSLRQSAKGLDSDRRYKSLIELVGEGSRRSADGMDAPPTASMRRHPGFRGAAGDRCDKGRRQRAPKGNNGKAA